MKEPAADRHSAAPLRSGTGVKPAPARGALGRRGHWVRRCIPLAMSAALVIALACIQIVTPLSTISVVSALDVGTLDAGRSLQTGIVLECRGFVPLHVDSVSWSCGCAWARLERQWLLPGEKQTLQVNVETANREGSFSSRIDLLSSPLFTFHKTSNHVLVSGTVRVLVRAFPNTLEFGKMDIDVDPRWQTCIVQRCESETPFAGLSVRSSSNLLVCTHQIDRDHWEIRAAVAQDSKVIGPFHGHLEFQPEKPASELAGRLVIPVSGEIVGDVSVFPSCIVVGVVAPSSLSHGDITISSKDNKPLRFEGWKSSRPDAMRITDSAPFPGGLHVHFQATAPHQPGDRSGNLILKVFGTKQVIVRVPFVMFVRD